MYLCTLYDGKVAGLIWIRFNFFSGLGSTYISGHDDFAAGPTPDRYYIVLDVHQKFEDLRSNQPLFLVSGVRH